MRRLCSSLLSGVTGSSHSFSTFLTVSACRLQRGSGEFQGRNGDQRYGGNSQRGGNFNNNRGYDQQQQQQQQQRGGYGSRGGNQRYENQNSRQKQQQQQYGSGDRRPGARSGSYSGDQGGRGRGQRREPQDFLQQNVEALLKMKHDFKHAKASRDRRNLTRDARRLVRRTRIDPSTQDEKSISVLLNCAAMFNCAPSDGVEQAIRWMRDNLRGLSPQNVAQLAYAVGVLHLPERRTILLEEVSPIVQSVLRDLTPVEVVMILQAFQRCRISENAELQERMLQQLPSCIETMPISQLSTLASVLGRHEVKSQNEALWRELVQSTMNRALADVSKMHSKEAITFLGAAPYLSLTSEQLCALVLRVSETAQFHTDEHVGELLHSLFLLKREIPEPSDELAKAMAELQQALIVRLDRVADFTTVPHATVIWRFADANSIEIPAVVQQKMCDAVVTSMVYHAVRFGSLSRLARSLSRQKLQSAKILNVIGNYAIGERPPRPTSAIPQELEEESMITREEREGIDVEPREHICGRFAGHLTALRISLEDAWALNGFPAIEAISSTLPRYIEEHMKDAKASQILKAVKWISCADDDCKLRNKSHDEAVLKEAVRMVQEDKERFAELRPAHIERFAESLAEKPKAQEFIKLLKECTAS